MTLALLLSLILAGVTETRLQQLGTAPNTSPWPLIAAGVFLGLCGAFWIRSYLRGPQ